MSEKEKFLIIKKFIDQMDYDHLLAGGAPSDEFDGEVKEICAKVRFEHSAQEIADSIACVMNAAFDENYTSSVFLSVAEQIKKEFPD